MIGRISKQQQLLVGGLAVGGLVLGLLGYLVLVSPQKSSAQRFDDQIQAAELQLAAAKHTPKVAGASIGAAELFRLTKAIPGTDDVPGILFQLSRLADQSKVKLVAVTPSPDVPLAQGYSVLPLAINVTGKYAQVTGFLHRMRGLVTVRKGRVEATGRLFVIDDLNLAGSDNDTVAATVKMNAFTYGAAPPLSATASSPSTVSSATSTTASTTPTTTTTTGSGG
jgi:Tfp pilus assembly protein PilO